MKKAISIISLLLLSASASAVSQPNEKIKYKTAFGKCPSRAAGTLTLKLVKDFEKNRSLRSMKNLVAADKLKEKHFLSDYTIKYNPMEGMLNFIYECPSPLMKVQIYKENGMESYEAILVDNGQLFDPTYEILLRTEKKLNYSLPYLAIPVGEMDKTVQKNITRIIADLDLVFRKLISEVIISDDKELTMILSIKGKPSSVFMGKDEWPLKVEKLTQIIGYMNKKKKIPSVINITNSKKVVVKFND
ncbi:hypothetical protein ACRXCV_01720 [Halobacteriovorax sp. GFR7]|uniref:hypothetical protein n=1 Tax=unclassified Halobacteriovorax TaxID=2639665 RepID=UPI003714EBA3